jgi:hypothetical protein
MDRAMFAERFFVQGTAQATFESIEQEFPTRVADREAIQGELVKSVLRRSYHDTLAGVFRLAVHRGELQQDFQVLQFFCGQRLSGFTCHAATLLFMMLKNRLDGLALAPSPMATKQVSRGIWQHLEPPSKQVSVSLFRTKSLKGL